MNSENKQGIRQYILTVLIVFLLFLILAGLRYLTAPAADAGIAAATETVLEKWSVAAPTLGKATTIPNVGWNYLRAFEAKSKNRHAGYVFIVRVTGDSGPVSGVFYWTKESGTSFCGIAGMGDVSPEQCGITPLVIHYWVRSIDGICATIDAKGKAK